MAISANALTGAGSTTDASSYNTASITPSANALVLAAVLNTKGTTPDTPTLSGNGLTWAQVATVLFSGGIRRLTLFRALGASPSAGAVTISFGGATQTGCAWSIVEYAGVDTSGTNGSGAIVQSVTNSGTGATSSSATLAAFGDATQNWAWMATAITANEVITPEGGWTERHDVGYAGPSVELETEDKAGQDTSPTASWTTSTDWGAIGTEIKIAPPTPITPAGETGAGTEGAAQVAITQVVTATGETGVGAEGATTISAIIAPAGETGAGIESAILAKTTYPVGWHLQVLGAGFIAGAVAAAYDPLAFSVERRLHDVGSVEVFLPRGVTATHLEIGRHVRLYRGASVWAGGIIKAIEWTREALRILATTEEGVLSTIAEMPDYPPLDDAGMAAGSTFWVGYYRPADQLLDWLRRPTQLISWLKERWSAGTITGGTVGSGGNIDGNAGTTTFETEEVDLGADGYLLSALVLEHANTSGIVNERHMQYKTSNTPGGGSYADISATIEEEYSVGSAGTGRATAAYPRGSTITLNRYVRFKVWIVYSVSGAGKFFGLYTVIRKPAVFGKGASWVTGAPDVSLDDAKRGLPKPACEIRQWYGKSLFEILREHWHDDLGYEFEVQVNGNGYDLHTYDPVAGTPTFRGSDKRGSCVLVWGEHIRFKDRALASADRLRTVIWLRSSVMFDSYQGSQAGDAFTHTTYERRGDVATYGALHETRQAQELKADNAALLTGIDNDLAASQYPPVDLEVPVIPTDQVTALVLGDIIAVFFPETQVTLPVRVASIKVKKAGHGEEWSLLLTSLRQMPWQEAGTMPTVPPIRRRPGGGWDSVTDDLVGRRLRQARRSTKPGVND